MSLMPIKVCGKNSTAFSETWESWNWIGKQDSYLTRIGKKWHLLSLKTCRSLDAPALLKDIQKSQKIQLLLATTWHCIRLQTASGGELQTDWYWGRVVFDRWGSSPNFHFVKLTRCNFENYLLSLSVQALKYGWRELNFTVFYLSQFLWLKNLKSSIKELNTTTFSKKGGHVVGSLVILGSHVWLACFAKVLRQACSVKPW